MNVEELIKKKIAIAEKRVRELIKSGELKPLLEQEKYKISEFYQEKSKNRLESAKIIYNASRNKNKMGVTKNYYDYPEVISAAYYSMYYIVHSFIAMKYKIKLREGLRGVHAITEHLILYYLVKTGKLAKQLYEEYLETFHTTAEMQKIPLSEFQIKAYEYSKKYSDSREAREIFTYNVTPSAEAKNAEDALRIANEFTNTIRQLMI